LHNKFPPTPRVGLVRPQIFSKRRIVQLSFFFLRRSFCCSRVCETRRGRAQRDRYRMRWTGQIFWLLAYDACAAPHLVPAFTFEMLSTIGLMGSRIQLQQRNCSRFSRDFLRRSTFSSSQRTGTRTSGLRLGRQDYLINCSSCCHVERSRDIPRNYLSVVSRDCSASLGMTKTR
jgi:hypothetical protein